MIARIVSIFSVAQERKTRSRNPYIREFSSSEKFSSEIKDFSTVLSWELYSLDQECKVKRSNHDFL